MCLVLMLLLALTGSYSGTLASKQEARLHPVFRMMLQKALDANGRLQLSRPELEMEREAIIHTPDPAALRAMGISVQSVYNGFVTAFVRPADLLLLSNTEAVTFIDPGVESYVNMDVSLPETGASYLHAGFINNTPLKGQGAIVLIYDTGIDWKHLDFRNPADPTKSRILAIWDQTLTKGSGDASPPGFSYGVEYSRAQIDNELDGSPTGFVRESDTHGHGTHVAGIATGNGAAARGKYTGMAPLADIVVVKGGSGTFSESKIIDGLTYAEQKAETFRKPVVVNLSLGGQAGPHDGTLAEEIAINSFVATTGRVVCISAGNDGANGIHRSGTLLPGAGDTLRVVVPSYTPTPGPDNDKFTLDVWCNGAGNATVNVISPSGITNVRNPGETGTGPDESDGTIDVWNYLSPLNSHRDMEVTVHDPGSTVPRVGTWMIIVSNGASSPISYDAWLAASTVGSKKVTLTGGDSQKTISMPGTSGGGITAGSYVTRYSWPSVDGGQYVFSGGSDRVGNNSLFSSIGPTADGRQKPDIAAPGESIISSLSSSVDMGSNRALVSPDGNHTVMQGTSMAAPHVTGAATLLLGLSPSLTAGQIKTLLATTANSDGFATGLPNVIWGSGKLDVLDAMARSIDAGAAAKRSVISYDQIGSGYYWQLTGTSRFALRFSSSDSGLVAGVQVFLSTQDVHPIVGSGLLVCEVFSDGGGVPGSRIGNAVQIPFATLDPGTNNSVSLLGAKASINIGINYYVVLSVSSPGDTLAVLSDASTNGSHSMIYNGAKWNASSRNFRIRPVVLSSSGNFSQGGGGQQPVAFELLQNFPNPFNLTTQILYSIPTKGRVSLKVFDILGREVATLIDGDEDAGSHVATWAGVDVPGNLVSSGVYFYRLESGGMKKTQKMVLIK